MNIILLGAPGSGKGTQAVLISKEYDVKHVSTGDIFRENIKNRTELGLIAKSYIDQGHLCPDELTCKMVADRISKDDCKSGVLLDGFPRTVYQAEELEKFADVDYVIDLEVPEEKLIRRIAGRRTCPDCGGTYHIDVIGDSKICPVCHGTLVQRADDNEITAKERISVYDSQTKPLIDFYKKKGNLVVIDGDKGIEEIFADVVKAVR